jgi:hypothetical protein
MTEEQKKQYERQNAFNSKNYDKISVLVPKGKRDEYRLHSERMGFQSLSAFFVALADREILRVKSQK